MQRGLQGKRGNSEAKEEELLVVSNSSVIIAFARVYRLDLLGKLFRKILVPEAVWKEIAVEGKPGSDKVLRAGFIHVAKVRDKKLALLLKEFVDEGEAEAVALA